MYCVYLGAHGRNIATPSIFFNRHVTKAHNVAEHRQTIANSATFADLIPFE
jgi:hypothetical protein